MLNDKCQSSNEIMEKWNNGMMEYWNIGRMEWWNQF